MPSTPARPGRSRVVEEGRVRRFRAWPEGQAAGPGRAAAPTRSAGRGWQSLTSHAGADGTEVQALVAAGVHGIVVAGTGNGTVHTLLEAALLRAAATGVAVLRVSRCAFGGVVGSNASGLDALPTLAAPQARIELMLQLMLNRG